MVLILIGGVNNNLLKVNNLCLSFIEGHNIFKNISFSIEEKTINLISGNSGCGKSSLLMCIARVVPETIDGIMTGEIIFRDEHIEDKSVSYVAGKIAYMFQDPDTQLCTFTVEDEIAFALENLNMDVDLMEDKIDELLSLFGIESLKFKKLNELSGGEKQKVALASILALDPDLILMDEPTANLDPLATKDIVKLIKRLRDDMGKTILIIEHKVKEFQPTVDSVLKFTDSGILKINDIKAFSEEYKKNYDLPKVEPLLSKKEKILEVKNITFSYDKKKNVLKNISFNLYKGEILAIVGNNGVGKSTLTKILMGLVKPTIGQVVLRGKDIAVTSSYEIGENMGLVFQNPEHQFIKMEVEKELSLSLELHEKSNNLIAEKTKKYLDLFNLYDNRKDNPFVLSQGQKRRLSTASMMINGQPMLILDEPTYGQDRENLCKLISLLYEINKEGTSILIITHDLELVYKCCHRIIHLKDGHVDESITDSNSLREYLKEKGLE